MMCLQGWNWGCGALFRRWRTLEKGFEFGVPYRKKSRGYSKSSEVGKQMGGSGLQSIRQKICFLREQKLGGRLS